MAPITKEALRQAAAECGIDLVGFAPASPMEEARRGIESSAASGLVPEDTDWDTGDPAAFCDPRSLLPSAASVVVAGQCYLADEPDDLSRPGEPHGLIAAYTRRNHYKDLRDRLKKLATLLAGVSGGKAASKCCSCGPLAEKPLARAGGLGWQGKNGVVITRGFGSWVVLGEMATELAFEPDPEVPDECGDCSACMAACPTSAIVAPGRLDRGRCLQHLTNSAGPIRPEWRASWGKRLYGCSTCQQVCPKNASVKPTRRVVDAGDVGPSIPLIPLLAMAENEYRSRYRGNQISARWVRFDSIRRNACLSLGNSGDPAAVPALCQALSSDPSPLVRGHAAWALGRLGGPQAKAALKKALPGDPDAQVRAETDSALSGSD